MERFNLSTSTSFSIHTDILTDDALATIHLAFSVRNEASQRERGTLTHRQRLLHYTPNDPPLFNYNTPSYVARRQSNYWLQWTGPGLYFLHFFLSLSPLSLSSSSSFCSSRQQHLADVGCARVYTLSCTRQRFTYRYVPAIVAITSPLMALHNVICRPAPFLSDLFAPIVILLSFLLLSFSLSLSFSRPLFPPIFNPVIFHRERGNRVSSIKHLSVDIWRKKRKMKF